MGVRKITVVCGTGRRFVDVDFSDYGKTVEAIRKKWKLTGDFILQATVGEKGDHYDIIDDNDLADFKDTDTLIVRPLSQDATSAALPGAGQSFIQGAGQIVDDSVSPPSYEQSLQHSQVLSAERRMSVTFEGMRKLVNVDAKSYAGTKNAIRQKFGIEGEFDFQGKLKGQDDYFDIQGDTDIEEIEDAELLQVQRTESRRKQAADKGRREKGQKKTTVICDGVRKLVNIDMNSLENTKDTINLKFSIGDDFDIQGKLPGQDEYFDIQDDVDLQDFHDAESFQIRRKVAVPRKVKQSDDESKFQVGQKQAEKKTTVVFEGVRKLVPVDMNSLANTLEAIRQRFQIKCDIELCGKLPGSEEHYNIQDGQDLADFKDAVEFVAKLLDPRPQRSPAKEHAFKESFTPAMEQPTFAGHPPRTGHPSQTFMTQVPMKAAEIKVLPVTFEGRRRSVACDMESIRSTRDAIREKFRLEDDFTLRAQAGPDDYRDIEDESDIHDFRAADALLIERVATAGQQFQQPPGSNRNMALQSATVGSQVLVPSQKDDRKQDLYLGNTYGDAAVIQYEGESYSLYQPPPKGSRPVLDAEEELAKTLNINSVVEKMELTADFLRLAYLGVVQNRNLHKIIQDLQFDIAKLTKLCDTTLVQFRIKAADVINDLETGFAYLLEENEEFALENFESIGKTSEEVLKKTKKLQEECESKELEVRSILAKVTTEYRASTKPLCSTQSEDFLKWKIEKGGEDASKSVDKCQQLEAEISDSKSNIAKDAKSKKPVREDFFKWVKQGYLYTTELDAVVTDKEKMLSNMAKEERLQELDEIRRAQQAELRANRELMEMLEYMKKIDTANNPDEMVNMALRGAELGVRALLAALAPVTEFWELVADQCTSIAHGGVQKRLEKTGQGDTGRNPFWTGPAFKRQALSYYSRWVALAKMCDSFHTRMQRVEQGIQLCIRDNPSREQARERLPGMLAELEEKNRASHEALKIEEANIDMEQKKLKN